MQNIQNESELLLPSNPILGQEGKEHLAGGQPSQGNSIPNLVEFRLDKQEGTNYPNKHFAELPIKVWSEDIIAPYSSTYLNSGEEYIIKQYRINHVGVWDEHRTLLNPEWKSSQLYKWDKLRIIEHKKRSFVQKLSRCEAAYRNWLEIYSISFNDLFLIGLTFHEVMYIVRRRCWLRGTHNLGFFLTQLIEQEEE